MKSEERHQLHENVLQSSVERALAKVEPYTNQILFGILVLFLLGVGAMLWARSTGSQYDKAWADFANAREPDDFLTVADDHKNSPVTAWAKLRAGELFLNRGLQVATSDSATFEERLKNAESAFQGLLQGDVPAEIKQRAVYGLAVTRESLSKGDTQPAVEAYQELIRQYEGSPYASIAKQRVEDLQSETTQEFYAWFQTQQRKPDERPQPKDLPTDGDSGSAPPFVWNPHDGGFNPDEGTPATPGGTADAPPSPGLPRPAADDVAKPEAATTPESTPPLANQRRMPPHRLSSRQRRPARQPTAPRRRRKPRSRPLPVKRPRLPRKLRPPRTSRRRRMHRPLRAKRPR
ncbi:MAG: hypothetical protein R3B90_18370 [Planctomycetaceae bacterium]